MTVPVLIRRDHRRTGLGRIDSADDYVASVVAPFEQSPDAIIEPMYELALKRHGILTVAHTFGTLAEGGGFESAFMNVALFLGDRLVGALRDRRPRGRPCAVRGVAPESRQMT